MGKWSLVAKRYLVLSDGDCNLLGHKRRSRRKTRGPAAQGGHQPHHPRHRLPEQRPRHP